MTTRSQLLNTILRTWDQSIEGRLYLRWMTDPDVAGALEEIGSLQLEGGDILREAVLEIIQGEEPLRGTMKKALEEFCSGLLPDDGEKAKRAAADLAAWILEIRSVIAERADDIKRASQGRGGRLEFFKSLALLNLVNREVPDEDYISDFPEQERYYAMWKKIVADEKTASDFAANSRTTTGVAVRNLDSEESRSVLFWRFLIERLLDAGGETSGNKRTLGDAFADWKTTNYLDRHYSYELVARLPQIVDRASVLERVQHKEVANETVRRLFTEAHEVFLYGFDNACIALCRSLIEHALREKLRVPRKEKRRLEFMIQEAEEKGLLDNIESTSAEAVEAAGNHIMHNIPMLRSTAQTVLDHTRNVLNKLYRDAVCSETESE